MKINWLYVGVAAAFVYIFKGKEAQAMLGGTRLSQKGIDFILDREGTKMKNGLHIPYGDGAKATDEGPGNWATIGYGHLIQPKHTFVPGQEQPITEEEARALFEDDVQRFVNGVTRLVKVPLTQNEFDALVSFAFNLGLGNLSRSTLLKRLNAGDKAAVPLEMMRWEGTQRRTFEGRIFSQGVYTRRNGTLI